MTEPYPYRLFEVFGIELEYMIVDGESLAVRPLADHVLEAQAGERVNTIDVDGIGWSNELALHVIELKTSEPARQFAGLVDGFQAGVARMNAHLAGASSRLLPSAMHPLMDPSTDFRLWPHDGVEMYGLFDRIFDCRGHGWSNLQSMHINLPFGDDAEFARLHAAIRLVLPLLPALAASSPFIEGRAAGTLDQRLFEYRNNARRVPRVSGSVIPEAAWSRAEYEAKILKPIYADLAPHDPNGQLAEDWVNSRGAIAMFFRGSIEIRLIDVQESPRADLAIAFAVIELVRALAEERLDGLAQQQAWHHAPLAELLWDMAREGEQAVIRDRAFLETLRFPERGPCRAGDLWQHLIESVVAKAPGYEAFGPDLAAMLRAGTLASRLIAAVGPEVTPAHLRRTYSELADCLANGTLFRAGG